jgi:hypothetical protein
VIGGMKGQLGEAPLHAWFYEQVKKSTVLKEEVAHYDRVEKGHPHKTYPWLMGVVRKYVMVKRRDLNREKNVAGAFTGAIQPTKPATPAKAEGKGSGSGNPDADKQCYACGRKGHTKANCLSSEETCAKYRASKGGGKGGGKGVRSQSPAPPRGKGKGKGKDKGKKPASRGSSPAGGNPKVVGICWLYNRGECTAPCPNGRRHEKWSKEEEARANRGLRPHSPAAPKAAAAGR